MKGLHYIRAGAGGQNVLFVHGNLASANWWAPIMELLQAQFDMVAVDLRGFGKSQPSPAQVSLRDHALDIANLVKDLEFTDFTIVGHSLGGAVAMQLGAAFPELVSAMVLVDSAPLTGMKDINYVLLEQLLQNDTILTASLQGTMAMPVPQAVLEVLQADCLQAKAALIPNTRALDGIDFSGVARNFLKPVLVVHGENDVIVPAGEAQATAAAYPNSRLEVLPGVGHNPQIENPPLFARLLAEFLTCPNV